MPIALDQEMDYEHSGGFILVDEGFYPVYVFEATPKKHNGDPKEPYYELTYRIDGTNYDGTDLKDFFVAAYGKGIFKLYDLLVALGKLDAYYSTERKAWHHLPSPDELQGVKFWLQVEHETRQSEKDGQKQYETDGSPKMVTFARPTLMYPLSVPEAELKFRKTIKSQPVPAAGAPSSTPQYNGGAAAAAAVNANDPWA